MKTYQRVGLFAGPLVFLLLMLAPGNGSLSIWGVRCLAIVAWILIWWATEAVHYGVAAALPIILFPLTGITKALKFNPNPQFVSGTVLLVVSMLLISTSIVKWNLHKRIALGICLLCGSKMSSVILGFVLGTGIASMFMSNTTATTMMIPIALALLESIKLREGSRFKKALVMAIPFAASCGGIGTMLGGATNLTGIGIIGQMTGIIFSFNDWLKVGLPFVIILLPVLSVFLILAFDVRKDNGTVDVSVVRNEYNALGPMSKGEKMTAALFIAVVASMITRVWWGKYIPVINDTMIAVIGILLFMVTPVDLKKGEMLLDAKTAFTNFPAPVALLVGSSLALGNAMAVCGVTDWIATLLSVFNGISPMILVVIMAVLAAVVSEFCTNQVVVAAFLPIMFSFSNAMNMNPLILMVTVTVSASFAFALPSGTPPTAIAMSTGEIELVEMIKYGFLFKLIAILLFVPVFYFITLGIFKLGV